MNGPIPPRLSLPARPRAHAAAAQPHAAAVTSTRCIQPRLSLPARPCAHAAAAQPHAAAATSTLERVLALPLRV